MMNREVKFVFGW